jgi:hypothetical protein
MTVAMTPPQTYLPYSPLSREEIVVVVERVLARFGELTMDAEITAALYPSGAPWRWADWSPDAEAIYMEAIELFCRRRKETMRRPVLMQPEDNRPSRRRHVITTDEGWRAVNESLRESIENRLTWPDLGRRLGVHPRAAEHLLKGRLGFRFTGRYQTREIVQGPCMECGKLHPMGQIDRHRHGPCCAAKQAA